LPLRAPKFANAGTTALLTCLDDAKYIALIIPLKEWMILRNIYWIQSSLTYC
jgi:hypothetical protein